MSVPNLFSPNTTIFSSEINANFSYIDTRLNTGEAYITALLAATQHLTATVDATFSAEDIVLDNTKAYQAKDSGGNGRNLMFLDEDDILKFGMFVRQGGSAGGWDIAGTTTYTESQDATFQMGTIQIANTTSSTSVTFSKAFSQRPLILVSRLGHTNEIYAANITTTGFDMTRSGTSGNIDCTWLAFGNMT